MLLYDPSTMTAESLAQQFERGDVPPNLTPAQVRTIACALRLMRLVSETERLCRRDMFDGSARKTSDASE